MINNPKTSVPAVGTSFRLENKVPVSKIGDSHDSLMNFWLYAHGYTSDIGKCYLRALVDELTSRLRLMVWYNNPEDLEDMVVFRRRTMDFGDSISTLVIRIIQENFLAKMCRPVPEE